MNPYEILQIEQGCSKDEIRKAFLRLAHIHHPDKGGDEQKFKEIYNAYQLLAKPVKDYVTPPNPPGYGNPPNGFYYTGGFRGYSVSIVNGQVVITYF